MSRLVAVITLIAMNSLPPPRLFISEEGSFSVMLPWRPSYDTVTESTPEGPSVRHAFHYADDEVAYFVFHACLPPPTLPSDPQAALDLGRDSGLRVSGGTLVSEHRTTVQNRPATRLIARVADNLVYTMIVLGDNGAYYSLGAAPQSPAKTPKAVAFLDSFKILPPSQKAWCKPH